MIVVLASVGDWASFGRALGAMVAFGVVGIALMALGFKVFDWMTPGIHVQKELAEKHNIAVAMVMAAVILGVAAVTVMAMV